MQNKYIDQLKIPVLETFAGEKVKIILFGSRARNDNHVTSDVDIGFLSAGKLDIRKMLLLEEKLEALNIPYKVELVDLSKVPLDFVREAMRGAVVWKKG